jgi:pantoate--beta-alanine ligase
MYESNAQISISFGDLENVMEGAKRPGHFRGVGIVVGKLFNMVQPDRAYFGLKDLQQCLIVERLVRDLSFPIELVKMPTVREKDGLAMSSRNARLTEEERKVAPKIYQALKEAEKMLHERTPFDEVRKITEQMIREEEKFTLEYFEIARLDDLQTVSDYNETNNFALCIALFLGQVRLIDNVIVSL